jgi:hypothetical protein
LSNQNLINKSTHVPCPTIHALCLTIHAHAAVCFWHRSVRRRGLVWWRHPAGSWATPAGDVAGPCISTTRRVYIITYSIGIDINRDIDVDRAIGIKG